MNKLTHWMTNHQVVSFFVITFAISWGLGFSYDAVANEGTFVLAPAVFVATCGPALAGILVTAATNAQPRQGTSRAFWTAFFVAWVVSALVFLAHNTFVSRAPFSPVMVGFVLVTVVPVAFVISMAYSRIPAVKSYMSSLTKVRGVWGWSLLALAITPALVLLSILISSLLGRQPITAHRFEHEGLALVGLVVITFLYQLFFFNATGEEVGWRGFVLPRMQSGSSPLIACLAIKLFWPLLHLFPWMAEGRPVFTLAYWVRTYLELLPATVTIGWLYNRSKGSILVAGLTHAAANTAFALFPNLDWTVFVWTNAVAALAMVLVDRMWERPLPVHPAVYGR